ncbi:MAG TPA: hydantoinase/oxoprolinase family protein [Bryobacteraceae bacterium]|jgi:N-methylhydantoinase A|nr:hydantoinase/oxoprolinase family protein [Bryobacteraceae bacterium]
MRIGIDSGGTFTDFVVLHGDGKLESFKLRSNPASPASVILAGLARIAAQEAEVVHGSTVATNALLERKGAKTAFVTTRGFEDIIAIGRQNRPELYHLMPPVPVPLVPRELCFGVVERVLFDGTVERSLDVEDLRERIINSGVEAVAVCLLHSYRNDVHERALLEILPGYVCASCDVSPEFREFERASTTVINAYVGPLMDRYLGELEAGSPHPVSIMQSNGGLLTAGEARRHAVRTILSGPAGGIVGAVEVARACGYGKALTFDMGGTSTDVALAGQVNRLTTEARIDHFPVRVPMLDIHTVGAGGGSIAQVDAGGSLRVGPESAGADPGPACYGMGEMATVTDAHMVLGRIAADQLTGGGMRIDAGAAERAVSRVAKQLGLSTVAAAAAIVRVANSNMERAIRAVSVERGEDPRQFPLVAFGGCGGLHACELAMELGVATVIVPREAGALSALGMLMADRVRDYSAAVLGADPAEYEIRFRKLREQAERDVPGARMELYADIRYAGQSYELTVAWGGDFHAEHHRVYGYSDSKRATQVVTLRVRAVLSVAKAKLTGQTTGPGAEPVERRVWAGGRWVEMAAGAREAFRGAVERHGPLLITDYGSTTLVPNGWTMTQDEAENVVLSRRTEQ